MKKKGIVQISNGIDAALDIKLEMEGSREAATLIIDNVYYHFERIKKRTFMKEYRVDNDPFYNPQGDSDGYCYIIAPYSM